MNNCQNFLTPQQTQNNLGDGYLKFQVNKHISAVLSIKNAQEVIFLPVESVTSMPNMPACILGLINWQNSLIWVIDLAIMLNVKVDNKITWQYNIIIIRTDLGLLGLVVFEIKGTTRFISDRIDSPELEVQSKLLPYLSGYVRQDKEIIYVLDAIAIVQSSVLHTNS
ncbi:MAG: chemotaxis protein CheW [Cyanomargarita calcarea GSE-NOS-MK-12-04C]|jgi:twitching motility protein PilI|uniref:Chemotaxis protein CheW n=1 Tax=Cyanomargarita calcarea GSE-NOS-MK-12-04C TaxID=2839659 RepID=A0A951UYQ0_9CYAN|nr:chemotaxis protein CheW [Cyanomargarita calcarea GSE-NOS-MK-12-04C]